MADEILSQDELGALLDSVGPANGAAREQRIVEVDFARPDKLGAEQVRNLQEQHEDVAEELSLELTDLLGMEVAVELVSLGQLGFEVYRDSLPTPLVLQTLAMQPGRADALLALDSRLALGLIDRLLGGQGRSLGSARALTTLEHGLMDNVTSRFLKIIAAAWARQAKFTFTVRSRLDEPALVANIPAGELVLVASFTVRLGAAPTEAGAAASPAGEAGELSLAIPFLNLESALSAMGPLERFIDQRRPASDKEKKHLREVLGEATVPLVAELGAATLTIGQVLDLAVGDVLQLDGRRDAPIPVRIDGHVRLVGSPGRVGRKLGLLVRELHPDGE